jgi:hypothetical protein
MRYAVQMSSGAIIYIPNFINITSDIRKLIGEINRQTHNMEITYTFFRKVG